MFGNRQFTGGLTMFFFQFLVQAGLFFTIPLYLSVALGLSAIDTGLRIMPLAITRLDCTRDDGTFALDTGEGGRIRASAVVIASGARYRRLAVENLETYEGRGVWYWASPIEARLCANEEVILVGGGNSAGQAAVFLAAHASKVRIMVRGSGLAATMSRYLIDRIEAARNKLRLEMKG
jgi:thioredoxin reductase